jgi:hypothetical protein
MNALMKLTTVTLGTLGIVGGAALAQTSTDPKADSPTANVSLSPGSNLKRDSSLSSTPKAAAPMTSTTPTEPSRTSTWNTTSTTTTDTVPASQSTAPMPVSHTDAALAPRRDRN